jgi:hypothetical protein
MGKPYRLLLITIVSFAALAFAAPAFATYSPRLAVTSLTQALGGAGARIKFSQSGADDPTQKVSVLVPKGYTVNTSGANGAKIGTVQATVIASDLKATAKTTGSLVVAGRSEFPTEAQACVGNQTPAAVWAFTLVVRGTAFRVPVFVDTTPPEPAGTLGVAAITVCFQAGDTPKGTPNRAVLGSKIINFALTSNAISSPKEKGTFRWRASVTPFTAGTGVANLKGIVEVQSLVPLPLEISLDAKISSARSGVSKVTLSGIFAAAGNAIPGIFLTLERGTSPRALKRLGVISTNSRGEFGTSGEVPQSSRAQRFFVHVTTTDIVRDLGIAGCQATTAAVPCVDATVPYNVSSRTLAITVPAKR